MNEQPNTPASENASFGSGWATLDDTFFRLLNDSFSHSFCEGATALLAANDDDEELPPFPGVIQLPTQATADEHAAARRAAMRRHPSSRGRS